MKRPSRTISMATAVALAAILAVPPRAVRAAGPDLAAKAAQLYHSAMSAFRTRQYAQAQALLEDYVRLYGTHEYAAVAHLQLAYCYQQEENAAGYDRELSFVTGRYTGSPAWMTAYHARLADAKAAKAPDQYFALLEAMLASTGVAPWDLPGGIATEYGHYYNRHYGGRMLEADAGRLGSICRTPGWVMEIVEMAATGELAERALKALAKTFQVHARDLPPDWQWAHAELLRRSGKADRADALAAEYLDGWGDDPRGIDLLNIEIDRAKADANQAFKGINQATKDKKPDAQASAEKDLAAAEKRLDALHAELVKRYAGYSSLDEPLYNRLAWLVARERNQEFLAGAEEYLKTHTTSRWHPSAAGLWLNLAKSKVAAGDASMVAPTMAMVEKLYAGDDPASERTRILWGMDLNLLAGNVGEAAGIAAALVDERQWSSDSFNRIGAQAVSHKPFAELVLSARKRWKVPLPDPVGPAFRMLNQLKARLADDQIRHAEEIGEEMFGRHRDEASTIDAVKLLSDYYFGKVLPEPRDKWMARMIASYPHHPMTEEVGANQVTSLLAARQYEQAAEAMDTLVKNLPGSEPQWFHRRIACYQAADNAVGQLELVRRQYGPAARRGDVWSLAFLSQYDLSAAAGNRQVAAEYWMAKAETFTDHRARLYCLSGAWSHAFWGPWLARQLDDIQWDLAARIAEQLAAQTLDPEIAWKAAFAEVNVLAAKGEGQAAAEKLTARLAKAKSWRDLSYRADLPTLGLGLGAQGADSAGEDLARKLRDACFTSRDDAAIEAMLGAMYSTRKNYEQAAEHYMALVRGADFPPDVYRYFMSAESCLQQARSPKYPNEVDYYLRQVGRTQELAPAVLYRAADYYFRTRDKRFLSARGKLTGNYAASGACARVNELYDSLKRR